MFSRSLLVIALLAALAPLAATAQDTAVFILASEEPVVASTGSPRDWDGVYTDPGAVFYHDGLYHMFRNGFNGWPSSVQIGYLTSPDGIHWTEATEDPVLRTNDVPYAGVAALASSALVEDDGTWVLYFYTWESMSGSLSGGAIGRATATDPLGPWTSEPEPVLTHGSEGSWDELQVSAPRVFKTDDGYVMYFGGKDKRGLFSGKIGMARSSDGIHWTKYDDPTTTDAPFAESDPILIASEDRSNWFIDHVDVQQTPDEWTMLIRQVEGAGNMKLYAAHGADGIHWERTSDEPVWIPGNVPSSRGFWYTDTVYHDGTYTLLVESQHGSGTSIFAATHEGRLP